MTRQTFYRNLKKYSGGSPGYGFDFDHEEDTTYFLTDCCASLTYRLGLKNFELVDMQS